MIIDTGAVSTEDTLAISIDPDRESSTMAIRASPAPDREIRDDRGDSDEGVWARSISPGTRLCSGKLPSRLAAATSRSSPDGGLASSARPW